MLRVTKLIFPAVAVLALTVSQAPAEAAPEQSGVAGPALTEDECRAIWNTAAGRSDLGPDGARPYIDSFESVDTNRDKKISNPEFKAGCAAGLVHKFRSSE